jgi:hypothetical protein
VRAFRYARANWPWVGGLILSNLDASTSPYHTGAQDGMPWFSILNKDYSPRPAWKAFKEWRQQDTVLAASRQRSASSSTGPAVTPASEPAVVAVAPSSGQPVVAQSVADQAIIDPPALPTPTTVPLATYAPAATYTPITFPSATTEPSATPTTPTATPQALDVVPTATYPVPDDTSTPITPAVTTTPIARVRVSGTDGTGVNLRAQPRANAESLGVLPEGTLLDVVGDDVVANGRTWRNVRTLTGESGWVTAQYLSP